MLHVLENRYESTCETLGRTPKNVSTFAAGRHRAYSAPLSTHRARLWLTSVSTLL
jgi:hypothetical protein